MMQRQRIRQPGDGRVGVRAQRPGKPVENAFIESFNGKLRDECLNSHVFCIRHRSAGRVGRLA
jgi:transposase InsO family protein